MFPGSRKKQVKLVLTAEMNSQCGPLLLDSPQGWELLSTPPFLEAAGLNSASDSSWRHLPISQRGLGALKQDGVGWEGCVGWSKGEVGVRKKDGSRWYLSTFTSKDYNGEIEGQSLERKVKPQYDLTQHGRQTVQTLTSVFAHVKAASLLMLHGM